MSNEFISNHSCAPHALPEPLEDWIAVAVEGLALEPVAQLRAEYRAHIADALDHLNAEERGESAAIDEILQSLGDPKLVGKQLRSEYLTKSDLKFISKLERRLGLSKPRWARIALYLFLCISPALGALNHPSSIPNSLAIIGLFAGMFLPVEILKGSVRGRLLANCFSMLAFNLYLWVYLQFLNEGSVAVMIVLMVLPWLGLTFQSLRSLRLLMKMRRIDKSVRRDPECRA